ncbi:MAG: cobalt-precorrin-5B (C(1))-methyltransferase, partial [Deltaproteobacteria bacterium]|nr:cobalt-precorrin-5B (C(1))-methyltransferase [Deltaproteobacteria bacterium]
MATKKHMAPQEKSDGKQGLRTGFTTGACAAAAARAATRALLTGQTVREIHTTLPNGQPGMFFLARCDLTERDRGVLCGVIKDAGDDPDVTHGAEIQARVKFISQPGITLKGGGGVATVTRPGLGLEVGGPAINPVPRKNITQMVAEELAASGPPPQGQGLEVTIEVPGGETLALKTLNPRLGLLGGISILGTTGIVRPFSTAAFKASVVQGVDVAAAQGADPLVFTTGGKTEHYAMELFGRLGLELPEVAYIQAGDFIGAALRRAAKNTIRRVEVVAMMGKLSKMADGRMMTHASGSQVNLDLLARLAGELGAPPSLLAEIARANTARHVLEITQAQGPAGLPAALCRKAVEAMTAYGTASGAAKAGPKPGPELPPPLIRAWLVDFDGTLLARWPED